MLHVVVGDVIVIVGDVVVGDVVVVVLRCIIPNLISKYTITTIAIIVAIITRAVLRSISVTYIAV